ncbi:MAG TPA: transposase [Blastocatellia bacterium]|nr:transposase [Blastocatellia bacterium]
MSKTFYKRDLPHWHPPGASVFLTWRLFGSLPQASIRRLVEQHRLLKLELTKCDPMVRPEKERRYKRIFAEIDALLDRAEYGPMWLKDHDIAKLVEDALLTRYASYYELWSYVLMANHVHILIKPKASGSSESGEPVFESISNITQRLKGYTSLESNRLLKRRGKHFWQDESFDHWSRDENEFYRIIAYIENNPVKAGLVARAEDWPWSSASLRKRRGLTEIKSLT